MALSSKLTEELTKFKKLEKQYEGLIRTSRSAEQLQRSKVELKKIKERIEELDPHGLYEAAPTLDDGKKSSNEPDFTKYTLLRKFPMTLICPSSTDKDVNLMYTILRAWEGVFMTALFDKHVKLDYSLNNERDTHYSILANCKRYEKMFAETQEDYNIATRDDAKSQLLEMRRRYARQYLNEGATFLRSVKNFWADINEDIGNHGTKCTNRTELIAYDPRFEEHSFLNSQSVATVVQKSVVFLGEGIDALRLPEIPKTDHPHS
ncbi:MAG: hypothetical protein ABUK01_10260 [Leptospirales bacterium]